MKRPVGVILTAVVQILGSMAVLLLGAFSVAAPHIVPASAKQPQMPAGFLLAIGIFYMIWAGIGIATAAGLLSLKNWSRYSTLVFSGLLLLLGLLMAVVFAVMPLPAPPQAAGAAPLPADFAQTAKAVKIVMAIFALAMAGLGAAWLYYFSRTTVRTCFLNHAGEESGNGRPLSILILAVLNLLAVPSCLVGLWLPIPTMLFGVLVKGVAARAVYFVLLLVVLYLGIGLLRLRPASRPVAIAFYVLGAVNALAFYFLPGRQERFQRMYAESLQMWHMPNPGSQAQPTQSMLLLGMIGGIAFCAVAIYFLVTRRSAFERHATPLPPSPPPAVPAI